MYHIFFPKSNILLEKINLEMFLNLWNFPKIKCLPRKTCRLDSCLEFLGFYSAVRYLHYYLSIFVIILSIFLFFLCLLLLNFVYTLTGILFLLSWLTNCLILTILTMIFIPILFNYLTQSISFPTFLFILKLTKPISDFHLPNLFFQVFETNIRTVDTLEPTYPTFHKCYLI